MAKEQLPFNEELLVRQLQTVSDLKKDALLKRIEQQGLKSSLDSLDSSISGFGEQTKGDKQNYAEAAKALAANITRLESQNLLLDKPNPALTAQIETLRNQLKSYLSPTTLNQESLAQLRLHLETQRSQLAATLASNESALTYLDSELTKLEKQVEVIL